MQVPVGSDDRIVKDLLLGLGLLPHFWNRRSILLLLQFASHDGGMRDNKV